jgi:intein-encoded DNA endonuclease-like protein
MVIVITEDRNIIKALIEKALDVRVKKATGMRMMQGIYLPAEPISLYECESTKLYLGFSVRLSIKEKQRQVIAEGVVIYNYCCYHHENNMSE